MKFLCGILFLVVFAYSKAAGDQFECYKCSGDDCEGTVAVVDCYVDLPIVPPPTLTSTTETSKETTTEGITTEAPTTEGITTEPTTTEGTTTAGTTTTDGTTTVGTTTEAPTPSEGTTLTPTTLPSATEETTPTATDILLKNYRSLSRKRRATDDNYACYTISYKDGDQTKTQKGCANRKTAEKPCDSITAPAETSVLECNICSEPKCNSSATIHLSIVAIAAALYIRFLM